MHTIFLIENWGCYLHHLWGIKSFYECNCCVWLSVIVILITLVLGAMLGTSLWIIKRITLVNLKDFLIESSSSLLIFHCAITAPNPCAANDGKGPCSHMCLINHNRSAACACPHLMKLSSDKKTCYGKFLKVLF